MLTQWIVMVLNCNVLCHLQQCKCPDQDLWAPLYLFSATLKQPKPSNLKPYICFQQLEAHVQVQAAKKFAEWVEEIDEEQQLALLGLADDEEFVPAFEMDAFDSDATETSAVLLS